MERICQEIWRIWSRFRGQLTFFCHFEFFESFLLIFGNVSTCHLKIPPNEGDYLQNNLMRKLKTNENFVKLTFFKVDKFQELVDLNLLISTSLQNLQLPNFCKFISFPIFTFWNLLTQKIGMLNHKLVRKAIMCTFYMVKLS